MRTLVSALTILLTFLSSCQDYQGLRARYAAEKDLWAAQTLARRVRLNIALATEEQIDRAIAAYREVVAWEGVLEENRSRWDRGVSEDIARIVVAAKVALADLYFLTSRFASAQKYYASTLLTSYLSARAKLGVEFNLARSFYFTGEEDSLVARCASLLEDMMAGSEFWRAEESLRESFLNIPLVLVRINRDKGRQDEEERYARLARSFYLRVAATWRDSVTVMRAKIKLIDLLVVEEEWEEALALIRQLAAGAKSAEGRAMLELMEGRVLFYGLGKRAEAAGLFASVEKTLPGSRYAREAALEEASVAAARGKLQWARTKLRQLEKDDQAEEGLRAVAMLERALLEEKMGNWSEALVVLGRLQKLHPSTEAALEAPLAAISHYLRAGDRWGAERYLEKASSFYTSLIERRRGVAVLGLAAQDFLVENYLALGKAREIAELLSEKSSGWGVDMGAEALLKSANLYLRVLGERKKAMEILERCIRVYKGTRYARTAREELDVLEREQ